MQVKNSSGILFATATTSRNPPQAELVLIAKAKFNLVHGTAMTLLEGIPELAQGPLTGAVFADEDAERSGQLLVPNDFAEFKPHGEVLLSGCCYSYHERWVSELAVKLAVGRWSKSLMVYGNRTRGRRLEGESKPERFKNMPLDYRHAFGGADYPLNPVGKGHRINKTRGGDDLPNVVNPADKAESPAAASFAPLNMAWPQRQARRGVLYGDDYLENRFPYYAEDFDWRYFMAAPSDQWIERYWRGDEKVTLCGLNAQHAEFETQLPSMRLRAFVKDDRENFREVVMVLDTVLFDTDEQTATLTWRGLTPVRKRLATDVRTILVAREALTQQPGPVEDYQQQLEAFEADPLELDKHLPPEMKEMLGELENKAQPSDMPPTKTAEAKIFGDMLGQKMGGLSKDSQLRLVQQVDNAVADNEQGRAQLKATTDAMQAAAENPPASDIPPYIPIAPGPQPRIYLRQSLEQVRAKIVGLRQQVTQAQAAAPSNLQPDLADKLQQLDDAEQRLEGPELKKLDPTLRSISDGEPGPGADLRGQDLSGRNLTGVDLRGALLDGAILTDANLRGVNLEGASLVGTVLFRADMTDCVLRGADLSRSNAAEALLEGADLEGCKLDEAYFKDAKMARCRLPKAAGRYVGFPGADLTDAVMRDAQLEDADFQKTTLIGADMSLCQLKKSLFLECVAQRCRFEEANLDQTCFMQADLRETNFSGAKGERTNFMRARLNDAKFSYSVLPAVFFDDSVAPGASFYAADLRDGRLCRTELNGARFDSANLFGVDLSEAEVAETSFRNANLYDAKLLGTAGRNCDFAGANLTLTRFGGKI